MHPTCAQWTVLRGVYPFEEVIGTVIESPDDPVAALEQAIRIYGDTDPHPVVTLWHDQ